MNETFTLITAALIIVLSGTTVAFFLLWIFSKAGGVTVECELDDAYATIEELTADNDSLNRCLARAYAPHDDTAPLVRLCGCAADRTPFDALLSTTPPAERAAEAEMARERR